MSDEDLRKIIYGINPVYEALREGLAFSKVFILKQKPNERIEEIIALCKERKIQFFFTDEKYFEADGIKTSHQGIYGRLKAGARVIGSLDDYFSKLSVKPRILVLDRITDKHNVGAVSRSAWFFGVNLVIMEKDHSAPLDAVVHKISSGASLLMTYLLVDKVGPVLEELKERGVKLYAAGMNTESTTLDQAAFNDSLALVLGSEGSGIRPHILRACDEEIYIHGSQGFDSLNVSNAAAVILYEVSRQLK